MTDTSSDEEDRSKLLQAIDNHFISDVLFTRKANNDDKELKSAEPLPSLRYSENDQNNQYNTTGLNVTPEFQKYVAKHLSSLLDRNLKEVGPIEMKTKKKKRKKEKGVRLFHCSSSYLNSKDAEDTTAAHNAKRKLSKVDVESDDDNTKITESVVSADWIFTGEATRGWVKSTKGEVITGIHKDSGLVANNKKKKKKKKINEGGLEMCTNAEN